MQRDVKFIALINAHATIKDKYKNGKPGKIHLFLTVGVTFVGKKRRRILGYFRPQSFIGNITIIMNAIQTKHL